MIVGGQPEARAQLSSTIIDYHEPFDQGFMIVPTKCKLNNIELLLKLFHIQSNK